VSERIDGGASKQVDDSAGYPRKGEDVFDETLFDGRGSREWAAFLPSAAAEKTTARTA